MNFYCFLNRNGDSDPFEEDTLETELLKTTKSGNYNTSDFGLPFARMKRLQELELVIDDKENTRSNKDEYISFESTEPTTLPDLNEYDSESR